MINSKSQFAMAAFLLVLGVAAACEAEASPWSWGAAEKELRMGVAADQNAQGAHSSEILIRLENIGGKDANINLGIILGNGQVYYSNALYLLITNSSGETHKLIYFPPATIIGRMDPFVVPIPVGYSYELRCSL